MRTGGKWRVQLGAFGVAGNAEAMWNRVRSRPEIAGHPRLVGMVMGILFRSMTSFAMRMIDPNEFATLQDRMFANFNTIHTQLLLPSLLLVAAALALPGAVEAATVAASLGFAGGAIAALAVLCTAIAYILYFRLIASAGPSRALAVTFITPVFAVLYGTVFLGERITPWMVGCAVVIVCGTLLSTGLIRTLRPALPASERP